MDDEVSAAISRERRDELIAQHEALWVEYVAGVEEDTLEPDEEAAMQRRLEDLLGEYFDGLPRLALSRCPFCGELYRHSFDPWGVDGYWWIEEAAKRTPEPRPCEHFGVLQGALHLNGLPPRGNHRLEANVGPGAPFVIPRLFQHEPVVCVISTVPMHNGYTAYPIVYFSRQPLPPGSFTQSWTRTSYSFPDGRGGYAWRVDTDPWSFDLEPWVAEERVRWIEPGDEEMRVRSRRDGRCPYIGIDGIHERQFIVGDTLYTKPPPAGEEIDPFAE